MEKLPALPQSLAVSALRQAYDNGLSVRDVARDIAARVADCPSGIWITPSSAEQLDADAAAIEARRARGVHLPLFGVPFAVKDNIDVAGYPTTAACAEFAYVPSSSATVVKKLLLAGALFVGKTNLDQFATGLVGVRSPYGIPTNPFDARYIVGGSSSGSAAAVARGLVSFSLGTDTAGSGRIPAGFTGIVGIKPSRGLLSCAGVVPACRSLDCVSVFAANVADAALVAEVARGYDPADPYSRPEGDRSHWAFPALPQGFRFGIPMHPEFFGDREYARLFDASVARMEQLGGVPQAIDFAPLWEAASMLYGGPWVAERLATLEDFIRERPAALLDVTREIITSGARFSAAATFRAQHRLEALRQHTAALLRQLHVLLVPTAPTIYEIQAVLDNPFELNQRLGTYTNFVNLLDLAGVAVPAGCRSDGLPFGVTLLGRRDSDGQLAALGHALEQQMHGRRPAIDVRSTTTDVRAGPDTIRVCVVGAHLTGEPLNYQLTDLGARLVSACHTSPHYRLYALAGTTPPKPGLVRVSEGGRAIAVEVWEMARAAFGNFFRGVVPPLSIGHVELESGERTAGFLCEPYAVEGSRDISEYGGWRAFLQQTH